MNPSGFGTIIEIGDVLVSEDVVCEFFACDYEACRGACCIEGESGAPLEEEELEGLEEGYGAFSGLMTDAGRARVDQVGFFEVDRDGDLVTPCVAGPAGGAEAGTNAGAASAGGAGRGCEGRGAGSTDRPDRASGACAFCHFTNGFSTRGSESEVGGSCAGRSDAGSSGAALCAIEMAGLRKPVSCALYPIRVTKMPGGGLALNLHRWSVCKAAYEKGRREGVRAYEFLRAPLERRFGAEFYEALDAAAKHLM